MENSFYTITNTGNSSKIDISRSKLLEFLEAQGFRKMKLPKSGFKLVKIERNSIIKDARREDLMSSVKKKLMQVDNVPEVWEAFLAGDYIGKNNDLALEQMSISNLNISDKEKSYFYFRNGILLVTVDNMELINYEEYEGLVHEDQIIQHDLDLTKLEEKTSSMFEIFLQNISAKDKDRSNYMRSTIGYLIHPYKDPSVTKAVILVDQEIDFSGEANGGTGKSLVAKAIQKMTFSVFKDGKSLNNKGNRFFYQDVSMFHRILILDDVKQDFNFEDYYSVITGEMTVEEKYKAGYTIPFELSPKLLITSNYMIKGSGGASDERRKIEIEVFPHYNIDFTPVDDFKLRFFNDWDSEEWNLFYIDMARYCQIYLKNGIMSTNPINLAENKLKLNTDYSFVEFADLNLMIPEDATSATFNKGLLYESYREKYPVESRNITSIRFKKWIDVYCNTRKLHVHHFKSDSNNMIRISKL